METGVEREGRKWEGFSEWVNRYDEEILYVDHQIGKLLDALREGGRYDDAVRTAAKAREKTPDSSPQALELESRLELYRSGRAIHE